MQNVTNRQLLLSVLETEVKGRNARRRKRNYSEAHFPPNIRPIEEFDPEELESGISQAQLDRLKDLSWLDNGGNLVFAGPPGLGKILDIAETERSAGLRLRNLKKAQLLIIDEISYPPITRS